MQARDDQIKMFFLFTNIQIQMSTAKS